MRIVHFSDWHWNFQKLPEADLYVCTGDMYDNGPMFAGDRDTGWTPKDYRKAEAAFQRAGAKRLEGKVKAIFGSPDPPVVCVRGNHDFAPLAPLFEGANLVHEFVDNEIVEVLGLRITGHRGIPYINGFWSDEAGRPDLLARVLDMPTADLYLTHYGPSGIGLDGIGGNWTHYGLDGMLNNLIYRDGEKLGFESGTTKLHMFGHIHECGGKTAEVGGILFSNAATTYNVIEGDAVSGWKEVNL